MTYREISFDEFNSPIKENQYLFVPGSSLKFELKDLEELSLFLISQNNDDIDYSLSKEGDDFTIKFWAKNRINTDLINAHIFTYDIISSPSRSIRIGIDGLISFEDTNTLIDGIVRVIDRENITPIIEHNNSHFKDVKFPKVSPKPSKFGITIYKIPDEYFLVSVMELLDSRHRSLYFKADQIDGLIDLIKYIFESAELITINKK